MAKVIRMLFAYKLQLSHVTCLPHSNDSNCLNQTYNLLTVLTKLYVCKCRDANLWRFEIGRFF